MESRKVNVNIVQEPAISFDREEAPILAEKRTQEVIERHEKEVVKEFREQPIIEIRERPVTRKIIEQTEQKHVVRPTIYQEELKDVDRVELSSLEHKVKVPEGIIKGEIQEKPIVNVIQEAASKEIHYQPIIEVHQRAIIKEIHEKPIIEVIEQPIVRTIVEKPIIKTVVEAPIEETIVTGPSSSSIAATRIPASAFTSAQLLAAEQRPFKKEEIRQAAPIATKSMEAPAHSTSETIVDKAIDKAEETMEGIESNISYVAQELASLGMGIVKTASNAVTSTFDTLTAPEHKKE